MAKVWAIVEVPYTQTNACRMGDGWFGQGGGSSQWVIFSELEFLSIISAVHALCRRRLLDAASFEHDPCALGQN